MALTRLWNLVSTPDYVYAVLSSFCGLVVSNVIVMVYLVNSIFRDSILLESSTSAVFVVLLLNMIFAEESNQDALVVLEFLHKALLYMSISDIFGWL